MIQETQIIKSRRHHLKNQSWYNFYYVDDTLFFKFTLFSKRRLIIHKTQYSESNNTFGVTFPKSTLQIKTFISLKKKKSVNTYPECARTEFNFQL